MTLASLYSCSKSPMTWIAYPDGDYGNQSLNEILAEARVFKREDPFSKIEIILEPGEYHLDKSLVIDAGLDELTLRAREPGTAWIKGSREYYVKWEKKGKLLVCTLDSLNSAEQVFIDGREQILARYPDFDINGGHWNGHAPDVLSQERIAGWANPAGAIIHAMQAYEWGDLHFTIEGIDSLGQPVLKGGHQNNRPTGMHPEYLMVENVFEELDNPGEWYFNKGEQRLYWFPPENTSPDSSRIEIPCLSELIIVKGTRDNHVRQVRINGIVFSQSRRTFMKDYEPLLRSDWTIYRGGAIFASGTNKLEISDCELTMLGGNGIFLSGYNQGAKLLRNHIHEIGASGICFVGKPEAVRSPSFNYSEFVPFPEIDTARGPKTNDYPLSCLAHNNLIYKIGRVEKQVAGVQISMSMKITVSHNSIYDVPRAGINISEGTWGGHIIEYNDVFKTVQESGDHGSFNSWGRDRFWHPDRKVMDSITDVRPDMPLLDALHPTIIRNNRFRCDHGWDIDLDDGSSNYEIYNNLCLNGGIKLREGLYRKVENNIMINNGFHPHVWFKNSGDIFRHNIVMSEHRDIRLQGWGKEVDYNIFPDAESLKKAREIGTDTHSIYGDPQFLNPQEGDFRVAETSPALEIGFKNFVMDNFGVQDPGLKAISEKPQITYKRK
jgi:hypothetical protein